MSGKTDLSTSILPEGNWKLVWHDEFEGTELDTSKWDYRLHLMQQRHKTLVDDAARVEGGKLYLDLVERDGEFYSSHLQTGENYMDRPGEAYNKFRWPIAQFKEPKFLHKFGYYECRCKLPTQPGWWAAFWLQSPTIGSTLNSRESGVEVDIMENFTRDGIISHNNHWDGYGKDHKHCGSGPRQLTDTPDGFHTYGLLWEPDKYVYYVDGKETWRTAEAVSQREQFILVSTECMGYRDGETADEKLRKAVLPDAFIVDHVRVFDRK
jgi:beta-glucanase (GH16 family)